MNSFEGDTVSIKYPIVNITTDKKTKEKKLKEITAAICALLNSNGGSVVLTIDKDINGKRQLCKNQVSIVTRILEQIMIPIAGIQLTVSNIHFQEYKGDIVILVKKADSLIITNYNLYLPMHTQVVQVAATEIISSIINRKNLSQAIVLGSHEKNFRHDINCPFSESKMVQFKCLKSDPSKRTTLADRITGNKFSYYVSAFANHNGGHIYYGIDDNGGVEGQFISREDDMRDVIKKVEKAINKMIWPNQIGQPKRREHWEIFFEPVVDENSSTIPSTFVIVIYIAACLGGVFTEEPEAYEMVEGKVEKISFDTWKKKTLLRKETILQSKISTTVPRITWRSQKTRKICTHSLRITYGNSISTTTTAAEKFPKLTEVKLVELSEKVMVCNRTNFFKTAEELLTKYDALLPKAKEVGIFRVVRVYIEVALYRAQGKDEKLKRILPDALYNADQIEPGFISSAIYLLAATVTHLFQPNADDQKGKPQECLSHHFAIRALEHLRFLEDLPPIVRADLEQKSHLTLALFYLGCDMSGVLTKDHVDSKSLHKAKSSVTAVIKSVEEGNPMNYYREVQFELVKSILSYRCSQVQDDRKIFFLKEAFNFSKNAETLATEFRFEEMLYWARRCMALCTESLVRTHFKRLKPRFLDVPGMMTDSVAEAKGSGSQSPPNGDFLENKRCHLC